MPDATAAAGKRGRPKLEEPKQKIAIRLDPDVLAELRGTGPGWQTRVNDMLRAALGLTVAPPLTRGSTRLGGRR